MLDIRDLSVVFSDRQEPFTAVDHVSLQMEEGEIVGIVGESGSGKSMTAHALMGLIRRSQVAVSGSALFEGVDLLSLSRGELRQYQGRDLSIIFQEPMTSLNPTMRIGKQVEESLRIHEKLSQAERRARALDAMALAGLPDPEGVYRQYPHQLSGGMRQRVMIAAALVLRPKLLIADEPTTALDVTIQAQILETLKDINRKEGTAILFISHDLGVVKALCGRVAVMKQGRIVESGPVDEVFHHPREDYTKLLIASRPARRKLRGGGTGG
ncbi:MAG: ABC transporter ATP-binding protein [Clostridiales bacterium]|nr:ABC transporter ATP-binding protein [Clostridiales bacterium]